MVNSDRLAKCFESLVKIDSVSREEKEISEELEKIFTALGGVVTFDNAGEKTNGNCGNLVAKFKGNVDVPPMILSGHMDTVEPGRGVKPVFKNGVFKSDGTTILGSDDKSALAIIIEIIKILQEKNLPYGPIEVVITVCEEIGLQGAKNFDFSMISSKFGYILDSTDSEGIVTRAPAANNLEFKIIGKDAHAGACPELGINAISVASKAIAKLELGRIDHETTCNIGIIEGGVATNIVPSLVKIKGEVRSHDETKLAEVTDTIVKAFEETINEHKNNVIDKTLPELVINVEEDFRATNVREDHWVVVLAKKAAENLNSAMDLKTIGGGADANIFFNKGIICGVLGTGMTDVHTVRESIKLDDMISTATLLLEIINLHAAK